MKRREKREKKGKEARGANQEGHGYPLEIGGDKIDLANPPFIWSSEITYEPKWRVVGNCPRCGAPIFANLMVDEVPKLERTCSCTCSCSLEDEEAKQV